MESGNQSALSLHEYLRVSDILLQRRTLMVMETGLVSFTWSEGESEHNGY